MSLCVTEAESSDSERLLTECVCDCACCVREVVSQSDRAREMCAIKRVRKVRKRDQKPEGDTVRCSDECRK